MLFSIVDKNHWERREHFDYFFSDVPCTYSLTTELDITSVMETGKKIYPTMLYCIASVVNNHSEFRMSLNENGELGFFDQMHPCYTIFHKDSETFSNIWTEFFSDFEKFYAAYLHDISTYGKNKRMNAKPNAPQNIFLVSMIPWVGFSAFNLNLKHGYDYLLPIFTIGKYHEHKKQVFIPFSIQVHHSVCDGFHLSRFINELQERLSY